MPPVPPRTSLTYSTTAAKVSSLVVPAMVRMKSASNAVAGLSAPRRERARVSSTARTLAAAVKAYDSAVCSHASAVAPSGLVARAHPNDR